MRQLVVLMAAAFALAAPVQAQQTAATVNVVGKTVPTETFFEHSFFTGAKLSPNGRYVAMRVGEEKTRYRMIVMDLMEKTIKPVAVFRDADVGQFHWMNDERLVFTTFDNQAKPGERARGGTWLYAINRDGTDQQQITGVDDGDTRLRRKLLPTRYQMFSRGTQKDHYLWMTDTIWGSQDIRTDSEPLYVNLYKVDTKTLQMEIVERPAKSRSWMLDYHGEPRLTATMEEDKTTYYYRDPAANNTWRKLKTMGVFKTAVGTWNPVQFGPDGTLYVTSLNGKDKNALYRLNLATGEVDPTPIIALADFDFDGGLVFNDEKLLGVRFTSDATATMWFDEKWKAVQADLDARLPSTANHISIARRSATPWVMVTAQSATQPSQTYLYNTSTKELSKIGDENPKIDAKKMSEYDFVRYKARDGLDIPAWVTIPRGSSGKNLPMIMYVHGGPHVKGVSWDYDREIQFLASRGYAVMQPQFRGTEGYGDNHYKASFKQWGLKMQDDIADGAQWAIKQGIADPKRICIMGASYGGYSTLMGLINDPGLYKCGVNWVGVTDINLMYDGHWSSTSDFSVLYKKYGMPEIVGDQVKDAAQLKATSPLEQAHRITSPILLGYGALDRRVPIYHGRKFYEKIKAHNKQVEMVVYDDEGHGWFYPKNNVDWWNRVVKFLDQHIGNPQ
jgi:dipeptidyl aminopeptidase/acylaminoacyl peptidase